MRPNYRRYPASCLPARSGESAVGERAWRTRSMGPASNVTPNNSAKSMLCDAGRPIVRHMADGNAAFSTTPPGQCGRSTEPSGDGHQAAAACETPFSSTRVRYELPAKDPRSPHLRCRAPPGARAGRVRDASGAGSHCCIATWSLVRGRRWSNRTLRRWSSVIAPSQWRCTGQDVEDGERVSRRNLRKPLLARTRGK